MSLLFFFAGNSVAPNTATLGAVSGGASASLGVQNTPPANPATLGAAAPSASVSLGITATGSPNTGTLGMAASDSQWGMAVTNAPPPNTVGFTLAAQAASVNFTDAVATEAATLAAMAGDASVTLGANVSQAISYDLTTVAYATAAMQAGNLPFTTAQAAILPNLITAMSREVIRATGGRMFTLQTCAEIVTPTGWRGDWYEPARITLSQYPIQRVMRAATGRTTILQITNTDLVTNQEPTVYFNVTGDVDYPVLVYTGLTLSRYVSGTLVENVIPWTTESPYTTIQDVANAVNAVGGGWQATLFPTSTPNIALLPAAWMVGAREPKAAGPGGFGLDVFTQSLASADIRRNSGMLRVFGTPGGGIGSPLGDAFLGTGWDGYGPYGSGVGDYNQVHVIYQAGYSNVPADIQQVVVELIKYAYERLKTDMSLSSESVGSYSYTAKMAMDALPDWAMQIIWMYKDQGV